MAKVIAKRVSNYELFYDLVFVLAISQLTSTLHHITDNPRSIIVFIVNSLMALSIWMQQTFYLNKYGERDRLDIYINIGAMFIVGNFAQIIGKVQYTNTDVLRYNGLLVASYVLIILQYYLRSRRIGLTRDIKAGILSLSLSAACFAVLTALYLSFPSVQGVPYFFILWIFPPFIPWILAKYFDYRLINFPHLVERCQLITIITFGEAVLAIIRSYPVTSRPFIGFMVFVGMSFMFISYISQTYLNINHHQVTRANALIFAHIFLITGLNIFTVSEELWANNHHREWGTVLFVVGFLMYYTSLMVTSIYNDSSLRLHKGHHVLYAVVGLLGMTLIILLNKYRFISVTIFVATAYAYNLISLIHRRNVRRKLAKKLATHAHHK